MAPENELVKEDDRKEVISSFVSGSIGAPSSTADAPSHEALRNDVYTAAAYGDLEKLQKLVEAEVAQSRSPTAAAITLSSGLRSIIHGGDVNSVDHTGQTALHWSAVRGHIPVADLLLKEGARVDAADYYGYQTTHVAAQYGQTAFLYNIVAKWNADPDLPDNDGRSPLHWSAYKGFADCIRLLLFLDAYQGRQDKDGCTPLHWAAIKGNLEVCTVLVQAGKKDDLMAADNTGSTPTQLAVDKNHRQVAFFLGNARRLFDRRCENSCFRKLSKLGLAPLLWCIIISLLGTYIHSVVAGSSFPTLTAAFGLFAWLGVFLASSGLFMFYRCSRKDPGYIRRVRDSQNLRDDEPLLKNDLNLNDPALLAGNWSRLCTTCKIVKPLRTKHCSTCDRCVEQFDHHCPWVSNCIGKKNKWDFFMFLLLEFFAMIVSGSVAITRIVKDPTSSSSFGPWFVYSSTHHPGAVAFVIMLFFLFFGVAVLTTAQAQQISRNITTNEMVNSMRYGYLRTSGGRFRNPYDHGVWNNCSDFLMKGYNEDIEVVDSSSHSNEMGLISWNGEIESNHVSIDVDVEDSLQTHGHVESSKRNHDENNNINRSNNNRRNLMKGNWVSFGLNVGLGRTKNDVRRATRSTPAS
ncbi:hypothetical protein HPP92_003861 [Vanilla planifolia]|uniref:S-acyltransferase n=1 Tax=Vanilla planifolia TaxID=51239 RepID=A0A835S2L5_VANPL|nr:hypothetical protein HPP92_003861 [Vanilla planifolia]